MSLISLMTIATSDFLYQSWQAPHQKSTLWHSPHGTTPQFPAQAIENKANEKRFFLS
jgi:hypothetical protein